MKVAQHPDYDARFPGKFQWGLLDSLKMGTFAAEVAMRLNRELQKDMLDRQVVPGLRLALHMIAESEEVS
jgi:hypothetical protein